MVPVLIGVTFLTFAIANIIPGDPARLHAGPNASAETVQKMREKLGLNDPVFIRYFRYLKRLFQGDLGTSIRTKKPVLDELLIRFPATFELTIAALFISISGGIVLGTLSAIRQGTLLDHGSRLLALSGVAVPSFWLGILLQFAFFFKLGLLPSSGRLGQFISPPARLTGMYIFDGLVRGNFIVLRSALTHLILPGITLSLGTLALVSRTVRSSVLDVVSQDYIRTARSKGLRELIVVFKHVLRNALIPVVTMSGMTMAALLGGTVLIETVFTWPGMGLFIVDSIFAMDFPAITGFTILVAAVVQIMNLIVDISYAFLDPRIRYN